MLPPIHSLTAKGTTANSAREKAECLNSVFASKSCVPNPSRSLSIPNLPSCTQLLLNYLSFAPEKVETFLATLDSHSATGLHDISSCVLKTCSAVFALPLSTLFTLSFTIGHLLSAWKSVNITTLHNKGAIMNPLNYRPIMLLLIISKVMESIIAVEKIIPFLQLSKWKSLV